MTPPWRFSDSAALYRSRHLAARCIHYQHKAINRSIGRKVGQYQTQLMSSQKAASIKGEEGACRVRRSRCSWSSKESSPPPDKALHSVSLYWSRHNCSHTARSVRAVSGFSLAAGRTDSVWFLNIDQTGLRALEKRRWRNCQNEIKRRERGRGGRKKKADK